MAKMERTGAQLVQREDMMITYVQEMEKKRSKEGICEGKIRWPLLL
jgi:hypothetical protein